MKKETIIWEQREYGLTELLSILHISKTSFYRHKKDGCNNVEAIKKCLMNQNKHYTFSGEECKITDVSKQYQISRVTIYKYLKEGFSLEEAVSQILESKKKTYDPTKKEKIDITYYSYNGQRCTLQQIAKKEHISPSNLYRHVVIDQEDLMTAIAHIKKNQAKSIYLTLAKTEDHILRKDGMSLSQYCLEHGYNYRSIIDKIVRKHVTVEEAIQMYLKSGQDTRQTWKYQHGKVILKHLLSKYGLSSNYALFLMKKEQMTLDEVIPKLVFSKQNSEYNKNEGLYLYQIYCALKNMSEEERETYLALCELTSKEKDILDKGHQKITFIRRELLYYELEPVLESCSDEEKERLLAFYHISEEELSYINNKLYDGFAIMENSHQKAYYKKGRNI